jgi:hypothetical protein
MRGCLTWFFVMLAVLLIGTWVFAPVVAAGLVSAGLGTAGFESTDKKVTVVADPPIELLTLRADKVRIQATDARFSGLRIATVDLTLGGVGLAGRQAESVEGLLTGVQVPTLLGTPATISSVGLSGPSSDLRAILTLNLKDVQALASAAVEGQMGSAATKVTLTAPDKVTVVASGITVRGRLVVDKGGGLVLITTYPAGFSGPIDIIRPGPTQPLRLTSIVLRTNGATVTATLDPSFFGG